VAECGAAVTDYAGKGPATASGERTKCSFRLDGLALKGRVRG
jgi:hypothetical protein